MAPSPSFGRGRFVCRLNSRMKHTAIISKLNDPRHSIQFSKSEISSAVQAGLDLFHSISHEIYENIDVENIANSPYSRTFLAGNGGILLWQEDESSVIAQIVTSNNIDKGLLWTPRNLLSVVVSGRVQFELFDLDQVCVNSQFRPGISLRLSERIVMDPKEGHLQPHNKVRRVLPAPGTSEAVIITYFGKPQGTLDWIFDSGESSCSATLSSQRDSDLNQIIQSFLRVREQTEGQLELPIEAARNLCFHQCYLVRWSAMQLLWECGPQDEEVLEKVRSDPHPEISGRYRELLEIFHGTA